MPQVFDLLEAFFKAHQYTIAAFGVVGTFSAVIVSLTVALIAQRSNRTRITAHASKSVILHSTLEGRDKPSYVTVHIKNIGVLPALIPFSFFHWKVPLKGGAWIVNPCDSYQGDDWVPQKQYPIEIKARGSQTFFLAKTDVFQSELRKMAAEASFLERLRFHFLSARAVTDDGKIFKVKIDPAIRKEIHTALRTVSKTGPNKTWKT
jgi:hypothetical protein